MSKKNLEGQMDLFSILENSGKDNIRPLKEKKEQSVPEADRETVEIQEEKDIPVTEPLKQKKTIESDPAEWKIVMQKQFEKKDRKQSAAVYYLDYNQVAVTDWGEKKARVYLFENTKEAVDYYIEQLNLFGKNQ